MTTTRVLKALTWLVRSVIVIVGVFALLEYCDMRWPGGTSILIGVVGAAALLGYAWVFFLVPLRDAMASRERGQE